ncbi:SPFH domain/Band 7 family protein [Chitinophaga skermanii]|uniref:SPFH domain/Band 7 family protein n=1 Tax=Chitinophaga skermanii TaxID=331697 RepID=A0A327QIW2_9BACT|nr:slipin family protein [Chitinophaga skermanii]RAJ04290.1 SPFH domain/Band 7 family protein [Chitinophaga skermanii]
MKQVIINTGTIGILYKEKRFEKILTAGSYRFWSNNNEVEVHNLQDVFNPRIPLNIALQEQALAQALQVIDVAFNEIVLVYENALLKRVLSAGQYAFWKDYTAYSFVTVNTDEVDITQLKNKAESAHNLLAPYVSRTMVDAHEKVLFFIDNKFDRILGSGMHAFWKNTASIHTFHRIDTRQLMQENPMVGALQLDLLMQYPAIAEALALIVVEENQLAILFDKKNIKHVLPMGKYAYWKNIQQYRIEYVDIAAIEIAPKYNRSLLAVPMLNAYVRSFVVEPYEKGVLYVDGDFHSIAAPNVYNFWKNETRILLHKVDTRQQQLDMNGQEILTKDKANIRINFACQYKVIDILKAVENKEYEKQLYALAQLSLREQVGAYTLDELLDKRDAITPLILESLRAKVTELGVEVAYCGIRDIILPGDVKEILNQVLIAEKTAQANVIMRREETASTRSLMNTAKLMEDNAMLYKLKEMEYVEKIADKISNISLNGSGDVIGQLKQIFIPHQ